MNDESAPPSEPPARPAEERARAIALHPGRMGRRNALLAVGGVAAAIAGSGLYRRQASKSNPDLTTFESYPAVRDLEPLRFSDDHGAERSLNDFRGRVVLLNVWATWCPPCREEMPTLDRLQSALGGPMFEVVTVSIDSEGLPVVQKFFRQIGIKYLHPYIDTFREVGTLGVMGIPLTLLIDRDGREAARKLGPATWDDPKVTATIRRYLPDKSN
ncbi:MAG: TlpA disulfide reductase family protein [Caldimonas sp.]